MRQSHLFTKTRKDIPSDEVSKNAELLIRAGFIHKEMAGIYDYLPLGLRVLNKINNIIREEINAIGGQEVFLTALQNKETWETTGRWDDKVVDNWFKTQLKNGTEMGLGFTHEEALALLMRSHVNSYKDLPRFVYQIQTKFRNEARAKSGILRCREFFMKDLYSFTRDERELDEFYEKAKQAYVNIFKRVGIGDQTFITFASGGTFSKYSHEFQTVCESGEDTIYLSQEKNIAVNKEVYIDEVLDDLGLKKDELEEVKAIEVGNIFKQKTKFSEPLGLTYTDEDGSVKPVIMGAYGIGPGRVLGTIVEVYHDEKGIMWPESVAPYSVHLVSLCKDEDVKKADEIYTMLVKKGVDVLYDDRVGVSAGAKFADSDLIGIPKRIVVSAKTLEKKSVEVKLRNEEKSELVDIVKLLV
ncbi:MAG: aminoacyl--tRNA ligase-related protein [Candidatus Magasanikbacteria bacterium]